MIFLFFSLACVWVRAHHRVFPENWTYDTTLYETTTAGIRWTEESWTTLTPRTTFETTLSYSCEDICGCEWKSFSIDGKVECFKNAGRHQVNQAELVCQKLGAKLPLPENEKQNEDMQNVFKKMTKNFRNGYQYYDLAVLDIKAKENDGNWVKSNGENVTYFNWDKNEPSITANADKYVLFQIFKLPAIKRYAGKWIDDIGSNHEPVICQRIGKLI